MKNDPEPQPESNLPQSERLVVGCMTGSSIDGLDVALVKITGRGMDMTVELVDACSHSLDSVARDLKRFACQEPLPAGEITSLCYTYSDLHRRAISELLTGTTAQLIAIHGQTVYHHPPLSWQMLNPALIAYPLGIPVVYDMRSADLALGGQGAPITPIADYILFRDFFEMRAVVNFGGFANITVIPQISSFSKEVGGIQAGDVCVCNQLLDRLALRFLGTKYDEDGSAAMQGKVIPKVVSELMTRLGRQMYSGRSLGTGDELIGWIDYVCGLGHKAEDILRSACSAVAQVIAAHSEGADRLILAGGGARNKAVLTELELHTDAKLSYSTDFGIPVEFREAAEMAVLGALCQDRVPITLPQVTLVAVPPVCGSWVIP